MAAVIYGRWGRNQDWFFQDWFKLCHFSCLFEAHLPNHSPSPGITEFHRGWGSYGTDDVVVDRHAGEMKGSGTTARLLGNNNNNNNKHIIVLLSSRTTSSTLKTKSKSFHKNKIVQNVASPEYR